MTMDGSGRLPAILGPGACEAPDRRGTKRARRRFRVLGVPVDALDLAGAVEAVQRLVLERQASARAAYICVRDVNGVVECQRDVGLLRIHEEAALVTPDGMPVVWWGRLAGFRRTDRVYGPDLMLALCHQPPELGLRHFLYGGEPGVAENLAESLKKQCRDLHVVETWTPPFRPLRSMERQELVRRINRSGANIVWVGLSSPKQERFMADIAPDLRGCILIGVGAAFDFLSGRKRQAPRWLQRSGFEWLFRLATEPRRLWRRYLINNTVFLCLTFRHLLTMVRLNRPGFPGGPDFWKDGGHGNEEAIEALPGGAARARRRPRARAGTRARVAGGGDPLDRGEGRM